MEESKEWVELLHAQRQARRRAMELQAEPREHDVMGHRGNRTLGIKGYGTNGLGLYYFAKV